MWINSPSFIEAQKSALVEIPEEGRQKIAELEEKLKLDYLLEDANDLIAESSGWNPTACRPLSAT